ncbi:lipase [Pullulanibacillus camelliae]|uniref:Lipase n=1 Tax=Pullulanibacillus camelliae TaxID=1707096 RepID=A0A8J2YL75_9BACL|nr:SGNH/GDSL hydrolase family protein [Pullulanibacillus camelliae]GGE49525.1 lipase [Pullulanibacillus camelliae]
MTFAEGETIVFIGDSITEDGRYEDHEGLGRGYVRLLHDYFMTEFPKLHLQIINEGIGGQRITDLQERWQTDVIDHQPDWLSISIGINDVWRQLDSPEIEQVYPDQFEDIYRTLLTDVKRETTAKIILMEPTIIEEDPESEGNRLLMPYLESVNKLAEEFDCLCVPEHEQFQRVLRAQPEKALTTDGVHMTSVGRMLMATTWLKAVQSKS